MLQTDHKNTQELNKLWEHPSPVGQCWHNGGSIHYNVRIRCCFMECLYMLCTQHYVEVISSGCCLRPDSCSPFQTDRQTNSLRWRLFHPLRHLKKEVCLTQASSLTPSCILTLTFAIKLSLVERSLQEKAMLFGLLNSLSRWSILFMCMTFPLS